MQVMPGWGLHAERTLRFERLSLRACEAVGVGLLEAWEASDSHGEICGKEKTHVAYAKLTRFMGGV